MGSRALRTHVAAESAWIVERYLDAGLVVFGKTNTPEWGNHCTTEPSLFGATANPWSLTITPCGSSGGSAAAVAAGIVPAASGGDGTGSIRVPAACCGPVGLKPRRARTSSGRPRGRARARPYRPRQRIAGQRDGWARRQADGLPIGVQLMAPDETILLKLAAQLEAAVPWAGRKPPGWVGGR